MAVVLGGMAAAIRTPSPEVRSGVQHIAACVLFAALATELLPDVLHRRLPWVTPQRQLSQAEEPVECLAVCPFALKRFTRFRDIALPA